LYELEIKENKEKLLKYLNYFLWVTMILISYKYYTGSTIDVHDITWDKAFNNLLALNYVELVKWSIFIIACTSLAKHLLVSSLPKSSFAFTKYTMWIIPIEYRRPVLNVLYRSGRACKEHLEKLLELNAHTKELDTTRSHFNLLSDLSIKAIITLCFTLDYTSALSGIITTFSLLFFLIVLLYSLLGLIVIHSQERIKNKLFQIQLIK
jgi:hypothetical protein